MHQSLSTSAVGISTILARRPLKKRTTPLLNFNEQLTLHSGAPLRSLRHMSLTMTPTPNWLIGWDMVTLLLRQAVKLL